MLFFLMNSRTVLGSDTKHPFPADALAVRPAQNSPQAEARQSIVFMAKISEAYSTLNCRNSGISAVQSASVCRSWWELNEIDEGSDSNRLFANRPLHICFAPRSVGFGRRFYASGANGRQTQTTFIFVIIDAAVNAMHNSLRE